MSDPSKTICMATVTTSDFIPGTLVMIHSFLKHNPWFEGDIVIIHDNLDKDSRAILAACFERVVLHEPGIDFRKKITALIEEIPEFETRWTYMLSLEAFSLIDYDQVLFCDSDLLFQGSVQELFDTKQPLVCCGDGPHYKYDGRDNSSFSPLISSPDRVYTPLRNTFNAGMMLIGSEFLTESHYTAILDFIDPQTWWGVSENHTDQLIFNRYFAGRQHLISGVFNYLLLHREAIDQKEGVSIKEARVLHFNGPAKPWQAATLLPFARQDFNLIQAYKLWFETYVACLQHLYFKGAIAGRFANQPAQNMVVEE